MKRCLLVRFAAIALLGLTVMMSGCATIEAARGGPGQKLDPWENWNRKVFGFNESLDANVLKPVATAYAKVVPQMLRQGLENFLTNPADAWSAINNFLQGKFALGFQDLIRFETNTVFGLLGVLDVASEMGLEHQYEDFGQTLGHWGVGAGAYIVWPLIGPSTVRESFALPLDRSVSPALLINDGGSQLAITTLQIVNVRAGLLGASKLLDEIALDKYTFVRDAYLQRRRSLVFDGEEPPVREAPEAPEPAASAPASQK